ncbi:hypothetical protein PUT24_04440 [Streptomyces sp. SP17KL33]|nr:hypothetical protein [Streptomyces sp. SP17KL33]
MGRLFGVAVGITLGAAVFDSLAMGLALSSGVGGALGVTFWRRGSS